MILNGTSTEVLQSTDRVALAGDFFVTYVILLFIHNPVKISLPGYSGGYAVTFSAPCQAR